ncbi:MAG: arylsulfatase [Cyanobacteria bacterium SBLK]|nr:arylsulfatase [Cyanobacteria bacterium SBLK]
MFSNPSFARIGKSIAIFAIALSFLLGTAVPPGMARDLPLRDPEFHGNINETYVTSEADDNLLVSPAQPPEGAPNIVLIMLDDVGFGASETFGGPIHTPTLEKLAAEGLRYNRFHTTAMCSPTRSALLTGRNHHSVGSGIVTNFATGFPGYSGRIPQSTATVAKILQSNGYNTAWFGKNHNLPANESTSVGPFTHWPNELGFDYFYGFNDDSGETDQWYPSLYENHIPISQPSYPDEDGDLNRSYNLTRDLADKAVSWVKNNHSLSPEAPFFLYFAPGATHAPHQPPPFYTEKYQAEGIHAIAAGTPQGMFTEGWDVLQASICEKQLEMGIVPEGTQCTRRDKEIRAWNNPMFNSDNDEYRGLMTKQMQNYAGFLEYTDVQVGRMLAGINALGEDVKNNTLVIYVVGDNGASAEGSFYGTCNVWATYTNHDYSMDENLDCQEEWGNPGTAPHFAIGWAWATNAPFRWTKQVASYFGGIRNPMVISWPDGIDEEAKGELRDQFLHVVDVAPTILDVVGIDPPSEVNDIWQKPMEGASFANTFKSEGEDATPLRDTQYFEVLAHRGIYHDGWMASSFNQAPWINDDSNLEEELQDNWELFNLDDDFSQGDNLRPRRHEDYECPDDAETIDDKESDLYYSCKLEELKTLFDREAKEHNVYPLDDRFNGRAFIERPTVLGDRTEFEFYPGSTFLPGAVAPNFALTDYVINADLNISDPDSVQGVILANGGDTSGFSLYVNKRHRLVFEYNYLNLDRTKIVFKGKLPRNKTRVSFFFDYKDDYPNSGDQENSRSLCFEPFEMKDGRPNLDDSSDIEVRSIGCGGTGYLYVDGEQVASKYIEKTFMGNFTDSFDVGMDARSPVSENYGDLPFEFTGGEIEKVTIDLDPVEVIPASSIDSSPGEVASSEEVAPESEPSHEELIDRIIQEIVQRLGK